MAPRSVDLALVKQRSDAARALGERLREARKEKGLQQEKVAAVVGLTRSVVSHIEHGTRRLRIEEADAFAQTYGLPKSVLIEAIRQWE